MTRTKIEWATHTWNPVTGCTKVSEGCRHCYAERMVKRFGGRVHGFDQLPSYPEFQGPGDCDAAPFSRVILHPEKLDEPLHWRKPRRVFVCSMSDLFHQDVPDDFRDQVFAMMAMAPQHAFMVLTKRPERMRGYMTDVRRGMRNICSSAREPAYGFRFISGIMAARWIGNGCPNVWLGTSVENQATADERIPLLLQTPAAHRFVSCEPMLGPVDLQPWMPYVMPPHDEIDEDPRVVGYPPEGAFTYTDKLRWVICGGESGPGARPMHPDWARSMRDQCRAAGVPFHFKQVGEWGWASQVAGGPITKAICSHGHVADFNREDMIAACRDCTAWEGLRRMGKKAAGRELDGRTHEEFPEVRT